MNCTLPRRQSPRNKRSVHSSKKDMNGSTSNIWINQCTHKNDFFACLYRAFKASHKKLEIMQHKKERHFKRCSFSFSDWIGITEARNEILIKFINWNEPELKHVVAHIISDCYLCIAVYSDMTWNWTEPWAD